MFLGRGVCRGSARRLRRSGRGSRQASPWPHPPGRPNPSSAGVSGRIVVRRRRAGQDVEALALAVIDLTTHSVPDVGLYLPFVEQDGCVVVEELLRGVLDQAADGWVFVEAEDRLGELGCRRGLAAGFGSFDHHGTDDLEMSLEFAIDNPR